MLGIALGTSLLHIGLWIIRDYQHKPDARMCRMRTLINASAPTRLGRKSTQSGACWCTPWRTIWTLCTMKTGQRKPWLGISPHLYLSFFRLSETLSQKSGICFDSWFLHSPYGNAPICRSRSKSVELPWWRDCHTPRTCLPACSAVWWLRSQHFLWDFLL